MKKQLVLFAIMVFVLFSCSKEKEIPETNPIIVENTILKFENINELTTVLDSLNMLPKAQIMCFRSEEGFQSLFSVRENYYACLEFAEDEATYNKLLLDHADLLVDGSVTEFKIFNEVVYPVINRNGIVQIGDDFYKFTEGGQIVLKNGNAEKIKTLSESMKQTEDILVFKYNKSFDSKSYCGYYHTLVNVEADDGDRRASFYCKVVPLWTPLSNGQYSYRTYAYSHGIAEKKTIFGGWRTYNTNHEMRLNYRVILMNYFGKTTTTTVTKTDDYNIYYSEDVATGVTYNPDDQGAYQGIFDWINVNQYTHRGMDGKWLTISCEANPYGK